MLSVDTNASVRRQNRHPSSCMTEQDLRALEALVICGSEGMCDQRAEAPSPVAVVDVDPTADDSGFVESEDGGDSAVVTTSTNPLCAYIGNELNMPASCTAMLLNEAITLPILLDDITRDDLVAVGLPIGQRAKLWAAIGIERKCRRCSHAAEALSADAIIAAALSLPPPSSPATAATATGTTGTAAVASSPSHVGFESAVDHDQDGDVPILMGDGQTVGGKSVGTGEGPGSTKKRDSQTDTRGADACSARTSVPAGLCLDALPDGKQWSPARQINDLRKHLSEFPALAPAFPEFSRVQNSVSGVPCMLLDKVSVPYTLHAKKYPDKAGERDVVAGLASFVVQLLAEYQARPSPFLYMLDFSLMNVGTAKSKLLQFVDLESWLVADGGYGTFYASEFSIPGFGIYKPHELQVDSENSVGIVHARLKYSTLSQMAIMAVRAHECCNRDSSCDFDWRELLGRSEYTLWDARWYLMRFEKLFGAKGIVNAAEAMRVTDCDAASTDVAAWVPGASCASLANNAAADDALSAFLRGEGSGLRLCSDAATVAFNSSDAHVLGKGSFGIVCDFPLAPRYVIKVFNHVAGGPTCVHCACDPDAQPQDLAHHCECCNMSVCTAHIAVAVERGFHTDSCPYSERACSNE